MDVDILRGVCMRELKFRQFVNGRWHYFGFVDNTFIGPIAPYVENNPVVQFTGLKDLSYTEIYEGDIVQVLDADLKINPRDSDTGYGVIEWFCMGGWYIDRIHNSLMDIDRAYTIIVVGNIYENPELLEDTA